MRNRFGDLPEEEETKIDITPMLDVVFIMLIFFIVTATFVNEKGIDLNPPPPNQEVKPKKEKGKLSLRKRKVIFLLLFLHKTVFISRVVK